MKKLLIATLALITALSISLAACDKGKDKEPLDEEPDDDLIARPSDDTTTTGGGETTTGNGGSSSSWTVKNDTVYVLTPCYLRSAPTTKSEIVGSTTFGQALQRTESNGTWNKISYNGGEVYIHGDLITTSAKRVNFIDRTADNLFLHVKAESQTNLRNAPASGEQAKSFVATVSATNTANNEMKLVALSEDGVWARVSYTGTIGNKTFDGTETLYVYYEYITELNSGNGGSQLPG